jgi:hypothetical protein
MIREVEAAAMGAVLGVEELQVGVAAALVVAVAVLTVVVVVAAVVAGQLLRVAVAVIQVEVAGSVFVTMATRVELLPVK